MLLFAWGLMLGERASQKITTSISSKTEGPLRNCRTRVLMLV
jgi:hypothetical protein